MFNNAIVGIVIIHAGVIYLVNYKQRWFMKPVYILPYEFGTHLYAILGIYNHGHGICHAHGAGNLANKVVKARSVYNVDFVIAPLSVQRGGKNAHLAFVFNLVVVANSVFVLDGSSAVNQSGFKQHGFGKRSLAAVMGANKCHVFDVFIVKYFHSLNF